MWKWASMQVVATWKWWNHLKATAPVGKQLLTINLDETYVSYYQGLFAGNLAVTKKAWPVTEKPLSQPASRSMLRTGLTHVGIVCDVPLAQRLLPQVIIASEKVMTMIVWRAVLPFLPCWMHLIRMPSKWIIADCLVWIINLIVWNLRGLKNLYDIVLSMDVLAQHYCGKVVNAGSILCREPLPCSINMEDVQIEAQHGWDCANAKIETSGNITPPVPTCRNGPHLPNTFVV
jgi:hypothetical protein